MPQHCARFAFIPGTIGPLQAACHPAAVFHINLFVNFFNIKITHLNVSGLKIDILANFIMLFPFLASILYRGHFYDCQGHVTLSCKGTIGP